MPASEETSSREKRITWSPDETRTLIRIITELQHSQPINNNVYIHIVDQLQVRHKTTKTVEQCKIKWKNLRNFYLDAKRKRVDERRVVCPYYDEMHEAFVEKRKASGESDSSADEIDSWSIAEEIVEEVKTTPIHEPIKVQIPVANITLPKATSPDSPHSIPSPLAEKPAIDTNGRPDPILITQRPSAIVSPASFRPPLPPVPALVSPTQRRRIPEVCIKWNSYLYNMQNTLPELLLNGKFVDVTLACEGQHLKCHRIILSACSCYFEELLNNATVGQYPIIFLKDIKYWQMKAIIEFMYRGEVNVAQELLPSLIEAAESLRVKGLATPSNMGTKQPDYSAAKVDCRAPASRRGRKRKYSLLDNMTKQEYYPPPKESPFVTTILLPERDYTDTVCKAASANCNQCLTMDVATLMQLKNYRPSATEHGYSRPRPSQNGDESTHSDDGIGINDNTIFYSYLQISDSAPT